MGDFRTQYSNLTAPIQMKQKLIISSDGGKSKKVSGGAWIIAGISGNELIYGTNHDSGNIVQIHSQRAEIYGILSDFFFIQEYCDFIC